MLSLEFQNNFDQACSLTDKAVISNGEDIQFDPMDIQQITSNGGKADLTVTDI